MGVEIGACNLEGVNISYILMGVCLDGNKKHIAEYCENGIEGKCMSTAQFD